MKTTQVVEPENTVDQSETANNETTDMETLETKLDEVSQEVFPALREIRTIVGALQAERPSFPSETIDDFEQIWRLSDRVEQELYAFHNVFYDTKKAMSGGDSPVSA
jgi:hypothetical protein